MLRFLFLVFGFLLALLLVPGRGWGQSVSETLAQVLHNYQPPTPPDSVTRLALGYRGTVQLPPEATHRRTGTKDSDRGEVHLNGLLMVYDIGKMAGVHLSPYNRGGGPYKLYSYEERTVGLLDATLGLRPSSGGTEVVATLQAYPVDHSYISFPANFRAEVHSETELRQFLAMVFSYRPAAKP